MMISPAAVIGTPARATATTCTAAMNVVDGANSSSPAIKAVRGLGLAVSLAISPDAARPVSAWRAASTGRAAARRPRSMSSSAPASDRMPMPNRSQYLGARFGFDGLESTTDETLAALRRLPYFGLPMPEVAGFLQQCDLVKFADLTPSLEECQRALTAAEKMVRATMPATRGPVEPREEGR